jgi:hypothetical protein
MKHYYDPWGHAARIALNRVLLFAIVAPSAGYVLWDWILEDKFGQEATAALQHAWGVVSNGGAEMCLRVMFWQAMAIGGLATGWFMTWLHGRTKLRGGDQHHRGTRVVLADNE